MIEVRLFIGISLSNDLLTKIEEIIVPLEGLKTLKKNLHLTLEFLGELEENQIGVLQDCMNLVHFHPFTITCNKMTLMRNLLVLELDPSNELLTLQSKLHEVLATKGFQLEARPYYPHITLVRKYQGPAVPFLSMRQEVKAFHLYSSSRISGVLTYTILATKKSQ